MNQKRFTLKAVLVLVTLFCILTMTASALEYTETMEQIDETGWSNGAWNLDEDVGTAPASSVAEIIVTWDAVSSNGYVGVRNTTSALPRYIQLNEAEDGGNSTVRIYVQVDGSGNADFYGGANADYYLVGYWEGITFQEDWKSYQVTIAQDDMWYEVQSGFNLKPTSATHVIITNIDTGKNQYGGVRNTTSIYDLDRRASIIEAEGGGNTTVDYWVQTDANGYVEVYSEQFDDIFFINAGCFDSSIVFEEFYDLISGGVDVWQTTADYSADWWFNVGTIIDVSIVSSEQLNEEFGGIRTTGSTLDRKIEIRESEGAGRNGHGNSVKVGDSPSGKRVSVWDTGGIAHFLQGFFKIPPPDIGEVNLLFGAGFNHSNPFVILRWTYSGDVDNYEIQHSPDNITYSSLALTPNKNYNHTGLVNGSLHYYMVRSTFFSGGAWYNSSLSPINFERVWFLHGGAGGGGPSIILGGDFETYNVSLVVVVDGTNYTGTLDSLAFNDTDSFFVNETVGVAGFDIRFNFTGVDPRAKSLSIRSLCRYEGNPAHTVTLEAWDFVTLQWVVLVTKVEHNMEWTNHSLSYGDYMEDGKVWVRIYHVTAGVATHWLESDYVRLRAFIPQAQTGGLYWVALISLIILVGTLLFKSGG